MTQTGMDIKIVVLALSPVVHLRKLNSAYGRSDGLPKSFDFAKFYNRIDISGAVKPINKRHDTSCDHNKYHLLLTQCNDYVFVILKSGTAYTREEASPFPSSLQDFFFFVFCLFVVFFSLVRNWLNAGWFLVNSHYKRLCASLCTFETVQKIKVG